MWTEQGNARWVAAAVPVPADAPHAAAVEQDVRLADLEEEEGEEEEDGGGEEEGADARLGDARVEGLGDGGGAGGSSGSGGEGDEEEEDEGADSGSDDDDAPDLAVGDI